MLRALALSTARRVHVASLAPAGLRYAGVRRLSSGRLSRRAARKARAGTLTAAELGPVMERTLDSIERGLEGVLRENADFRVERDGHRLELHCGPNTSYTVAADPGSARVEFQSPISGGHAYEYDAATGRWLSVTDKHDFLGIFTRDLLRHSSGVATF